MLVTLIDSVGYDICYSLNVVFICSGQFAQGSNNYLFSSNQLFLSHLSSIRLDVSIKNFGRFLPVLDEGEHSLQTSAAEVVALVLISNGDSFLALNSKIPMKLWTQGL